MPGSDRGARKNLISTQLFPGKTFLTFLPVFAYTYILLILPFVPDDGKGRPENMLVWPILAAITLGLVLLNWKKVDGRFLRSWPIISLSAYLLFAAASVTWAFNPDYAFSRLVVAVLATVVILAPYALPISTKNTIAYLHVAVAIALCISGYYVLTTPASPIGHPGYFNHKQELGVLAATAIVLATHELLIPGWRWLVAPITLAMGVWLVLASQSKSAIAFALIAIACAWVMLFIFKKTRIKPVFMVAAVVFASFFVQNPIEKMGYRLYGDATLTGRTGIWGFANYQISRKPWLGWGFHSYYFVPNSPQSQAPGYIKSMPSSHSGYLELKLETGKIGYWIFLIFIFSSLSLIDRVMRKDIVRAGCFLSIELFVILLNLTDSIWLTMTPLWLLYLVIVANSVRCSWPARVHNRAQRQIPTYRHEAEKRNPRPLRTEDGIGAVG